MARPIKQGLSYFPFDVSFFSDRKVRKIIRGCGPVAPTILICLLCTIYEDQGYYILWDEELPFDIADTIGVSEGAVKELIKKAIDVDFFDKEMYERQHILTSRGIQSRFKESTRKRKDVTIKKEYWIIDDNNEINDADNSVNDTDNEQSKEKKTKEKNRKEISPSIPQRGNGGAFFNLNKIEEPPSDGAKRNYEALVRILTEFNVPADDFNKICELSNNGEIGHPVWAAMQHVKDSNGKIRMPGKYIISIIEQKK